MTTREWIGLGLIVAAAAGLLAWAGWMEWTGYCISEYTCTANVR